MIKKPFEKTIAINENIYERMLNDAHLKVKHEAKTLGFIRKVCVADTIPDTAKIFIEKRNELTAKVTELEVRLKETNKKIQMLNPSPDLTSNRLKTNAKNVRGEPGFFCISKYEQIEANKDLKETLGRDIKSAKLSLSKLNFLYETLYKLQEIINNEIIDDSQAEKFIIISSVNYSYLKKLINKIDKKCTILPKFVAEAENQSNEQFYMELGY